MCSYIEILIRELRFEKFHIFTSTAHNVQSFSVHPIYIHWKADLLYHVRATQVLIASRNAFIQHITRRSVHISMLLIGYVKVKIS